MHNEFEGMVRVAISVHQPRGRRTKRSTFQAPLIVHPDAVVSLEAHVRPGARAYLGDIAGAVTCWSSSLLVPPTAANYASFTYPKLPGSSLSWDHEWVKDIGTCFQYILLPRHAPRTRTTKVYVPLFPPIIPPSFSFPPLCDPSPRKFSFVSLRASISMRSRIDRSGKVARFL